MPEALDRLILALVAPDPADRPQDAATVARELDRLISRPTEEVLAPAGVVGRGPELERLRKALTQAWSGSVRTIVVAGENGIGKTTLLDALANEASNRGGVAVRGRGEAEGRPYGVWRPVVRALSGLVAGDPDPALGPLLGAGATAGGEEQRLQLYDAVADLLARPPPTPRCCSCSTTCTGPTRPRCGCWRTSSAPTPPRACCSPAPTRRARSRSRRS